MMDAEGSSTAAQSAQEKTTFTPKGLLERLLSWPVTRPASSSANGTPMPAAPPPGALRLGMSNLRRMQIADVAIPKVEIVAVPVESTLDELVDLFRESGFTRVPVYDGTLDMPVGMVHLKDVALKYGFNGRANDFNLRDLVRPLLYAPPSMPIGVLLQKMQSQRMHMALVIDEYGGTDGLVTIEDLIEQVIGEIEDEHDVEEDQPWTEEKPGCYLVLAKAPLEEFSEEIGLDLSVPDAEEDADTLGGVVFLLTGRVPARGEIVTHPAGLEIEIVDADPRRIKRLRVQVPGAAANAD